MGSPQELRRNWRQFLAALVEAAVASLPGYEVVAMFIASCFFAP